MAELAQQLGEDDAHYKGELHRLQAEIWGRSSGDLGEMQGRCRGAAPPAGGDIGEISRRSRGDAGEM